MNMKNSKEALILLLDIMEEFIIKEQNEIDELEDRYLTL